MRIFDRSGEGDGAPHRLLVTGPRSEILDTAFRECLVDADDASGIVDFEIVVFVLCELLLEFDRDRFLADREYEHSVVGQEIPLDSLAEAEAMEFRTELRHVVHACDLGRGILRFGFDRVSIDFRGGGHVETASSGDVLRVMDAYKVRLVVLGQRHAGGAMGFVANNQVEFRQAGLLRFADHLD